MRIQFQKVSGGLIVKLSMLMAIESVYLNTPRMMFEEQEVQSRTTIDTATTSAAAEEEFEW